MRNINICVIITFIIIFFTSNSNSFFCEALEAKWTPNEKDGNGGGGPLPLSQNQRQQLLELEQTITNSNDPEGTLRHVAKSNNMSPEDLIQMLQQNRQDLEQVSGQATASISNRASTTLPRKLLNMFYAIILMTIRMAKLHPKAFIFALLTITAFGYGTTMAPKTGLVLSSKPSLFSNGHSTVYAPPSSYIQEYMSNNFAIGRKQKQLNPSISKINLSRTRKDMLIEIFDDNDSDDKYDTYFKDGVQEIPTGRKALHDTYKQLSFAITSRKSISLESFFLNSEDEDDSETYDAISNIVFTAGQQILNAKRFTEFTQPKLYLHSRKKLLCLVMKKLGDFNRFGIQPLAIAREENVCLSTVDISEIAFYTVKGGHFDGELLIAIEKWTKDSNDNTIDDDDDELENETSESDVSMDEINHNNSKDIQVVVNVSLLIPKKGRKVSKKLAKQLVSSISNSISSSIMIEAKKNISRTKQLGMLKQNTQKYAKQRRFERSENVKKIEEMAKDRKRRWQRGSTGNGGRFRPSGDRMKSPNNC